MVGGAAVPENPVRLLGRYALHGEIAVGGMATVHFGRLHGAIGFSRTVAIKRLHKQYARDPEFVSMFLDEARLAARIRHPNVVPTLDVVATEGELFVVMEYVHGESLSRLIREEAKQGRFIPPAIVASILSATLQGLHAAHEARDERAQPLCIVHRDVSPQNILVGSDGVSRVLDFGVAKAAGRIHTTRQGQVKGKLPYMAPEQLSAGAELSRLVDIYAASVCLWEALTGRRLFTGDSEGIILAQVLTATVEAPSRLAPQISPEVDYVVMRGLSRHEGERFATAREMAVALERAIGRVASSAEVADWMESVAGTALAARHRTVAEIELQTDKVSSEQLLHEISSMRKAPLSAASGSAIVGGPVGESSGPRVLPSESSAQSALSHLSLSNAGATRLRYAKIALAVIAALVLLLCVVIIALFAFSGTRQRASQHAPDVAKAVSEPESLPAANASAASAASTSILPSPAASAAAPPEATAPPPAQSAPAASASAKTSAHGSAKVPSANPNAANPARKNCDPPYSIDSNGRKRFKSECL